MKKVAITGTIGSGKSTACHILQEEGYVVFDCDKHVDCYYRENHQLFNEIAKLFPCCKDRNKINKQCVAQIIFSNKEDKIRLETLIYATLETELLEAMAACHEPFFFAEVPLLYECGWEKHFDEVMLVHCDENVALERLVQQRGLSFDEAKKRLSHQMSNQSKIERASKIIYNNSDRLDLKKQMIQWIGKEKKANEFED